MTADLAAPGHVSARPADENALPIHLRAVGRAFGTGSDAKTVLRDIDLEVAPGEVIALLGPSGCGKSTLLRIVAGLDTEATGSVALGENRVTGLTESAAVAFQEPRLLPWRSMRENVRIGLPKSVTGSEADRRLEQLLDLVELSAHAEKRPREVSGGMAQRASLARALARRPEVLLLDEPFGALDALTRLKMQDLLLDVHQAYPATILLVTHDVDEALQLADRIVVLGREEGPPGSTISQILEVPGARPRDRADAELGRLRSSLLESLGVDAHRR